MVHGKEEEEMEKAFWLLGPEGNPYLDTSMRLGIFLLVVLKLLLSQYILLVVESFPDSSQAPSITSAVCSGINIFLLYPSMPVRTFQNIPVKLSTLGCQMFTLVVSTFPEFCGQKKMFQAWLSSTTSEDCCDLPMKDPLDLPHIPGDPWRPTASMS